VKCIIDKQVVLLQPPEGPFAAHIASFAKWVKSQGYAVYSTHRMILLAACFSRWLGHKQVVLRNVTREHVVRYLRYRARYALPRAGDATGLMYLLEHLRSKGVIPVEKTSMSRLSPVERCVQDYTQYLRESRALAETTIIAYVPFVREFLKSRYGDGRVVLRCLKASDVVRFVSHEAPRLKPKRAKLMTSALRSFLQHARLRGEVTLDLAAAVPIVANWSMPSLPRAIAPEQTRQLLASIDRQTAIGRRDFAILLLLARLGLRSSEVVFLELDDLDWNVGQLRVRGKSGQRGELPLPAQVGTAIATYLRRGRPDSTARRVFLRAKAPIRGFRGPSAIASIVRHSLQRAGVQAPTYGAHQFRHGLATDMLQKGASLAEIGQVLGHRHPQTTKIYTKVDIKALRTLALPWPVGVR
jgi:site-specific recombinase XerD